jgi:hypothetical protein
MAALAEARARAQDQAKAAKPKPLPQPAPVSIEADSLVQPIAKPITKRGMRKEERANSNESRKPWLALGITRRAWYYRQAKDKDSKL